MNKYFYFVLLLIFLVIPTVEAQALQVSEQKVPVFKQWTNITFSDQVRLNGGSVPGAIANISITDPKGRLIIANQPMTYVNLNDSFDYTLASRYTGEIGTYKRCVSAAGYDYNNSECFDFQVTPDGNNGLLGFYVIIIIFSYGIMFFGIVRQDITISTLGSFSLFLVGLWILFFGIDVFKNYLTNGFAIISLGIASYVGVSAAYEYIGT